MKNGWYRKAKLGNRNVPAGIPKDNIYGSLVSGEKVVTTFYVRRYSPAHPEYGRWALWKVTNRKNDKPRLFAYGEIESIRGGKSDQERVAGKV